ncbi:MAG: transcriptional regulator [Candidatus Margulisiibacteriota bacterium]|nr:MAG: hypothetical protein A2X43_10580 [Candidatus Margulisbacteria bacterium GWD2_39_127]OGI00977.1 MAG: hypothetical protein A2X42_11930 [Candidatus Margulisbacteria bacterium GWF2_38_17]OGI08050.1 MAG: hypothetical protein A2X41_00385 [Candidatus Margulisbacteria bacterium GWE2_39_32]PZM82088.1 MAG: transcriptional regulator [Candidatus Margulisiibacteriota bacterium]HAR62882.1 transcriptional regulator [Candidatus Margulisiibacteriota bacterium]
MVDNDVLLSKIDSIYRCLERIHEVTGDDPTKLSDFTIQDVFVLNLQRTIQLSLDIANHIIAESNWQLPDTMKASIEILHDHKVINENLKSKLIKMVGFRNISIHEYQRLDIEILKSILSNNLGDITDFLKIIKNNYLTVNG